jgi:ABC-type bacteriocin/lantibiotic exporter with double-glycine peptidase domain
VWDGREPQLYEALGTTEEGTSGEGIIRVAESFGLAAITESNLNMDDLRGWLATGCTIILSIQAWGDYTEDMDYDLVWDDGHYVVLVGIEGQDVYLMDPGVAGVYRKMTILELMRCWHDYTDDGEYDYHGAIILKGSLGPASGLRPISIIRI